MLAEKLSSKSPCWQNTYCTVQYVAADCTEHLSDRSCWIIDDHRRHASIYMFVCESMLVVVILSSKHVRNRCPCMSRVLSVHSYLLAVLQYQHYSCYFTAIPSKQWLFVFKLVLRFTEQDLGAWFLSRTNQESTSRNNVCMLASRTLDSCWSR